MERRYDQSAVEAIGQTTKLAPKVTDFIGRPGFTHRQELNPHTGRVEDVVSWTPNDGHGRLTRQAHEVNEALGAFAAADTARFAAEQQKLERATLSDADGRPQYVEPHLADQAAKRNGWRHRWRVKGRVVAVIRNGRFYRVGE